MTLPIPHELALADEEPFTIEQVDEVATTGPLTPDQLDEYEEQIAPELVRVLRWQVTDDGSAEWAFRMLAAVRLEASGIAEQAALWYERIRQWEESELGRLRPRIDFFDGHLRRYALARRREDPKRASISLPSGTISTRAAKAPTVDIDDEEALIKWAGSNVSAEEFDAITKVTTKVLVSELRKRVEVKTNKTEGEPDSYVVTWKGTGEIVDGATAAMSETTATATPNL